MLFIDKTMHISLIQSLRVLYVMYSVEIYQLLNKKSYINNFKEVDFHVRGMCHTIVMLLLSGAGRSKGQGEPSFQRSTFLSKWHFLPYRDTFVNPKNGHFRGIL